MRNVCNTAIGHCRYKLTFYCANQIIVETNIAGKSYYRHALRQILNIYFINSPFLKKNLRTNLSVNEGISLLNKTVRLSPEEKINVLFFFSTAFKMCVAHSSAVIKLPSSSGDVPCGLPSLVNAALRIFDAV